MSYEIFTYGNGQALSDLLNGIAAVMNDNDYGVYIKLGVMFGFAILGLGAAFDLKLNKIGKWYATVMVIYTGLLLPKVDVLITDPVMHQNQYAVSHVPIGLAYVLSTLTTIEYNLTNSLESALSVPADVSYNSTGMLMASDMVKKASSFKILNPDFAQGIKSYIQQCIQYDILHGKYTVNDLFNAGNIWDFTLPYASPARAFMYNGLIVTCAEGAQLLTNAWTTEIQASMPIFGRRLFGGNQHSNPSQLLARYLQAGYRHLGEISNTASQIMQQNMMINAYHDAVVNNAAELGAAAAVESYAVARATQNSRSAYKISGEVAGRQLPYLKNIMQMLIIGSFVVILPLFFFPSGVTRMKHFLEVLASLSIWAPLYAILNLQMSSAGRWKILGLTSSSSVGSHPAITIANLPGIEQIAADQAIMAGYLALSIPLISYGLIKSSMHAFTSLASGVMGVAQSSASHAAEEATTGNYTLGNLSLENTNAYNTSAFHDNGNATVSSGSISVQDMNGTMNTIFSNGETKTDQREAISSMAVHTDLGSKLFAGYSKSYNDNISTAESQSMELSQTLAAGYHDTYELAKAVGNSTSSDASMSMGLSSSEVQQLSEYKNYVDRTAEQTGASENEIFSAFANAQVSASGFPIKLGGALGVASTNDASTNHQNTIAQEISNTSGYSNILDSAVRVASDSTHRTSNDESTRISDSVRANLDKSESLRESISTNLSEAHSKQEGMSYARDNTASLNATGDQIVYKELMSTINPDTGRNYTPHDLSSLSAVQQQARIEPIVERLAADIITKGVEIDQKGGQISASFNASGVAIKSHKDQVITHNADNRDMIKAQDTLKRVDPGLDAKVDARLKGNDQKIAGAKDKFITQENVMKEEVQAEMVKSQAGKALKKFGARPFKAGKDMIVSTYDKLTNDEN